MVAIGKLGNPGLEIPRGRGWKAQGGGNMCATEVLVWRHTVWRDTGVRKGIPSTGQHGECPGNALPLFFWRGNFARFGKTQDGKTGSGEQGRQANLRQHVAGPVSTCSEPNEPKPDLCPDPSYLLAAPF